MKLDRSLPTAVICPQCENVFAFRSNKKFCSADCRKRFGEVMLIKERGNGDTSLGVRRYVERRAAQEWIYERVFGTSPDQRADVLLAMLIFAATINTKSYIDLFTYPNAQRSNRFTAKDKGTAGLHFRGRPATYPATLAAMANHVCKHHLGITTRQFIDEIRRDGVTMTDMQSVYDELMDTGKPEPVVQGCDIEEPAYRVGGNRDLTQEQITHAQQLLARYTPQNRPGICNKTP